MVAEGKAKVEVILVLVGFGNITAKEEIGYNTLVKIFKTKLLYFKNYIELFFISSIEKVCHFLIFKVNYKIENTTKVFRQANTAENV